MVLNIVLKYTHKKQAAKFAQEKLPCKPRPIGLLVSRNLNIIISAHHCEKKAWLLRTLSLHHLKYVHHALTLAAVNGGSYDTEHPRPADSITTG